MEKASKVMYTIANVFNYVMAVLAILGIVFSILSMTHVMDIPNFGLYTLIVYAFVLIFCIVIIAMVRKAKGAGTSKGWDVLFIVLGVLGWNVFYILGGIFGLVARR